MNFWSIILFLVFLYEEVQQGECQASYYYGYTPAEQRLWATQYPQCGSNKQSPIRIRTKKTKYNVGSTYSHILSYFFNDKSTQPPPTRSHFPALNLSGYERTLPKLQLINVGNTVDLHIHPSALRKGVAVPSISGGNMKDAYQFINLHFHWSYLDDRGSEHVFDKSGHSLELHIVHRNVRYTNEEALQQPDGFAVLAVLFQLSSNDGPELYPIMDNIDEVEKFNTSVSIRPTFSLNYFLGNISTQKWYHYEGSLTTPPCSENVQWYVFANTLKCSAGQLDEFRTLETEDRYGNTLRIYQNSRELQPLNNRTVYYQKR